MSGVEMCTLPILGGTTAEMSAEPTFNLRFRPEPALRISAKLPDAQPWLFAICIYEAAVRDLQQPASNRRWRQAALPQSGRHSGNRPSIASHLPQALRGRFHHPPHERHHCVSLLSKCGWWR